MSAGAHAAGAEDRAETRANREADGLSPIGEVAADYIGRGWQPVPLFPRNKKPRGGAGWQRKGWVPDDFRDDDNIGAVLGNPSSGLTDLDCDIAETRRLAAEVFPQLPVFGRAGAPGGHRLVVCSNCPGKIKRFRLPPEPAKRLLELEPDSNDKTVVLEIRSNGQTMFPPSIHPSGERVEWTAGAPPDHIPVMAYSEILLRAQVLALCAVVLRAYPDISGSRNEVCLALSGTLIRLGLEDDEVNRLVLAVAHAAGDEEAESRGGNAETERTKLEHGEDITGLPRLLELLGLEELEKTIRKWVDLTDEEGPVPPNAVVMREGKLPQIVDKAEDALLRYGSPIYQRGGELIRTVRIDSAVTDEDGVRRAEGATILKPAPASWLVEQMSRAAPWYHAKGNRPRQADPAPKYAHTLLARAGEWRFPALRGLIKTPTLDRDGRIIQTPGYDPGSGLLLDFTDGDFPPIPENPTKDEAAAALERLAHPLRAFPFVDGAAKSVALSATLTGMIRPGLPTAPGFAFDSPVAANGKTKLVGLDGILMTGQQPPAMSQGKTDEETEKRLSAALRAGDPILLMDNCDRAIQGDFLCSMLTSEMVSPRILGLSENMRLPSNVLFCATGNNLVIAGDAAQRFLICRLDAEIERPDQREFDFDCVEEVMRDRAELVVAALTVLRAYFVAGQPESLTPFRDYYDWNVVRGALVWLGYPDPADTRDQIMEADPKRNELLELVKLWEAAVGDSEVTVSELHEQLKKPNAGEDKARLLDFLVGMCRGSSWNGRSIGWRLREHKDRVIGGRCFRAQGKDPMRWKLDGAAAKTGSGAEKEPDAKKYEADNADEY